MRKLFFVVALLLPMVGFAQAGDTIVISPDLRLVKLTDKVYQHISTVSVDGYGRVPSNGLVVVSDKKALLIDTPWNNELTKQLHNYFKTQGVEFEHVVVTHWHADRMGGLGYLQKQFLLSTSGQRTYDIAKQKGLPVAFIRFADTLTFKFKQVEVQCYYPGAGHTSDNIVVYLPSEKLLFAGCMIKDLSATGLGNIADADVKQWPVSMAVVKRRFPNAEIVVPGHGQSGGLALVDHTLALLQQGVK
jgi:metallo-beta-lactamase class B